MAVHSRTRPHHELAQQLDLARRVRGLSSRELAAALVCDPRSVRRYLSGERCPNRQVVELWERACRVEPGTLIAFHDRATGSAPHDDQLRDVLEHRHGAPDEPPAPVPARFAGNLRRLLVGCVALALALGVSLFFLLRPPAGRDGAAGAHSGSEVSHHFTRSYTGVVWLRITPAGSDAATDLRVRLRWGRFENSFAVKQLASGSRTFTLQKNDRDDVTFLVRVEPRARVDFGEGKPPDRGAQEVPSGWRKRTSG